MAEDRFGNPHAPGLPYAHGEYIRSSKDDHAKLRHAWRFIEQRARKKGLGDVYNFSGLERRFEASPDDVELLDDELAPAFMVDRLNALALDHLGGDSATHGIITLNRQTAATLVLAPSGRDGDKRRRDRQPHLMSSARRSGAALPVQDTVPLTQWFAAEFRHGRS